MGATKIATGNLAGMGAHMLASSAAGPRQNRDLILPALILEKQQQEKPVARPRNSPSFAPPDADALKIQDLASRMAEVDLPVLLVGGKAIVRNKTARLIHRQSFRRNSVFMQITCSSFTAPALELTLFGQDLNTPAGTVISKQGLFETCRGGTVFIDDLTAMSEKLQARLLTLLDEKWICRADGHRRVKVNVRIVVSISTEIQRSLETGKLRHDLYRRLDCLTLRLPQKTDDEVTTTREIRNPQARFDAESDLRLATLRSALSALHGGAQNIGNT